MKPQTPYDLPKSDLKTSQNEEEWSQEDQEGGDHRYIRVEIGGTVYILHDVDTKDIILFVFGIVLITWITIMVCSKPPGIRKVDTSATRVDQRTRVTHSTSLQKEQDKQRLDAVLRETRVNSSISHRREQGSFILYEVPWENRDRRDMFLNATEQPKRLHSQDNRDASKDAVPEHLLYQQVHEALESRQQEAAQAKLFQNRSLFGENHLNNLIPPLVRGKTARCLAM